MKRIVFEVNTVEMFDRVKQVGPEALGSRLVETLLQGGEVSAMDAVGLAVYGITVCEETQ